MRRALGRLLGIFVTLVLTSMLSLGALSLLASMAGARPPARVLPLYVNPAPRNVHDLSLAAIQQIASGQDAEAAGRELVRLGGAALPHVLPNLEALRPEVRGKVALALAPLARRMGVGSETEFASEENAIAFWARFWQDRAFDFRPQIVRRLVARLAERASVVRREDILHLDTYALPEIMVALGRVSSHADVERARRLTLVLSHMLGRDSAVDAAMSVPEARTVVEGWRRLFAEQGGDYTTLDGPQRVVAVFAETRYGKWLGRVFGVLRLGYEQGSALGMSLAAAVGSLLRYAAALVSAALAAAGWLALELRPRRGARSLLRFGACLLAALPAPFVAALFVAPERGFGRSVLAAACAGLAGAAILSRIAFGACAEALGSGTLGGIARGAVLRMLPSALPWISTALFGLELLLDIDGAARATVNGLYAADVTPGMATALGAALVAAASCAAADVWLGRSRAALREPALVEVLRPSRRMLALSLVTLLALGVLAVSSPRGGPADGGVALATGARALLGYGVITTAMATVTGLILGALAASGPRPLDALLGRSMELAGALPAALWAAALAGALGSGLVLAFCLGALRGIDVAWLVRSEVLFRASADQEIGIRSLGRYPLVAYVRERLRPTLGAALSALALTPAWLVAIAVTARIGNLGVAAGRPGWDHLLGAAPGAHPFASGAAGLLLVLCTLLLLSFVTSAPRRLAAARPSMPPP